MRLATEWLSARMTRRGALSGAVAASGMALTACRSPKGGDDVARGGSPGSSASMTPASPSARRGAKDVWFLVSGPSFAPSLELSPGSTAEVRWLDRDGKVLAKGAAPTIELTGDSQRVQLETEYADILTVNVGFDSTDDAGEFSLDDAYDRPPQAVTRIVGLPRLTNLRLLLAANTPLSGSLDCSGLAGLQHIECFKTQLESVDLTGCESLVRLCVEENHLSALDLNPIARSLRDLRAAAQKSGRLDFTPLAAPLAKLRHLCVRDQTVTGHPTRTELPNCIELWNWNADQAGSLPVPGAALSVLAAGNAYVSADLSGQWQRVGSEGVLDLSGNHLATIDITGCRGLQAIRLGENRLSRQAVDRLLAEVSSWGTPGVELVVDGTNQAPSEASTRHIEALQARGWLVTVAAS